MTQQPKCLPTPLVNTFHELFFAQGVIFMMMKVVEVAVDGHLQCRVFYDTINIMLVINMEDSKTHVTINKSKNDLERLHCWDSFNALQNTSQDLSWLPEAFLSFGFRTQLVAQHQNVPFWDLLLNCFLINIFPLRLIWFAVRLASNEVT